MICRPPCEGLDRGGRWCYTISSSLVCKTFRSLSPRKCGPMTPPGDSSWREQLRHVRSRVDEAEQQRAMRRKLDLEKTKDGLRRRLAQDSSAALLGQFNDLRLAYERIVRKLYPPTLLHEQQTGLAEFGEKLRFYRDCQKDHPDLFSSEIRQTITRLLKEMGGLQRGVERQLRQWEPVEVILERTNWRPPAGKVGAALLEISKAYNEFAFEIALSVPADFYSGELDNYHLAYYEEETEPYGFVQYVPDGEMIVFAVVPFEEVNFRKLARGFVSDFYSSADKEIKAKAARVRLTHPDEFKFFNDLGFSRAETRSINESVYQWVLG